MKLDVDRLIADCYDAVNDHAPTKAVREVLARTVSDPAAVVAALGEPGKGEVQKIHVSDELTLINVIWAPAMTIMPHNHNMAAVIGVYTGREDNIFWRRVKDDPDGHIEAAGADSLGPGKTVLLGKNIIH